MGNAFLKRRLKKLNSAASVLTVEEDSDDENKDYPVAESVTPPPIASVRLSKVLHTPLENAELVKLVNPSPGEEAFRSNLSAMRTMYDWDTIPLDFFVDGYVGGEKTRRSLKARSLSRSRAKSESRIHEPPPALPPRKKPADRRASISAALAPGAPRSPLEQFAPTTAPPDRAVLRIKFEDAGGEAGSARRPRSRTIASPRTREMKPTEVPVDTMYVQACAARDEQFEVANPILALNHPAALPQARTSAALGARASLTPGEEKTYNLYVHRNSVVLGPDGQPMRRSSVVGAAPGARRSIAQRHSIVGEYAIPETPPPVQPRRSIPTYSDARPRSNSPEV
jgi:hypothetical protein